MTASLSGPVPSRRGPIRLTRRRVPLMLVVLAIAAAAAVGLVLGRTLHSTASDRRVLVGRAYHSPTQGAVRVGGWAYGFEISPTGMNWYDTRGGSHEGGIPSCLQHPGYSWLRFSYTTANGPDGESWRPVAWVQCTHKP